MTELYVPYVHYYILLGYIEIVDSADTFNPVLLQASCLCKWHWIGLDAFGHMARKSVAPQGGADRHGAGWHGAK